MNQHRYLWDSSLMGNARVKRIGGFGESEFDYRPYVVLDQTLFHPVRPNQSDDRGEIAGLPVVAVRQSRGGELQHHLPIEPDFRIDTAVTMNVDPVRRCKLDSLRLSADLLAGLAESIFTNVKVIGIDYRPHRSRVEVSSRYCVPGWSDVETRLRQRLADALTSSVKVATRIPSASCEFCRVAIGGLPERTSHGTYPQSTNALTVKLLGGNAIGGRLHIRFDASSEHGSNSVECGEQS
ncbi:hypothetical protein Poly51_35120 [Rubripirellula tenax]|uniref:Uncharacterized protein n=1 Tax=Rubripirellula tenax TaxID=2528015 RepID=A0A5C6EYQ9_9BACT|nr:hypothetical protein Poly51_35120 [Rubripirellula tenax]